MTVMGADGVDSVVPLRGVLLDFDGVISSNATAILQRAVHEFINEHEPLSLESFSGLFKAVTAFPMREGLGMVLSGIGLPDLYPQLAEKLKTMSGLNGEHFELSDGLARLVAFCRGSGIRVVVCSTMDQHTSRRNLTNELFSDKDYLPLGSGSKADPATYPAALARIDEKAGPHWLMVDDSPLALRAGKLAGLSTVAMPNEVFTGTDIRAHSDFVDVEIESLHQARRIVAARTVTSASI